MPTTLDRKAIAKIGQWFAGHDTGVSSSTMASIALGAKKTRDADFDAPHDSSDFGRCLRLVEAVPEVRGCFPQISRLVKPFDGILKNWDELVSIYKRDMPKGRSDELYRRINELRGDCADRPVLRVA